MYGPSAATSVLTQHTDSSTLSYLPMLLDSIIEYLPMQVLAIDQVSEVSCALTWTMDNIAQYGGDPERVFLMGHSSGTTIMLMVLAYSQ